MKALGPARITVLGAAMLASAALLAPAPAFAEDLVVVESVGAAFTPGQTVDGAKPLQLEIGQQVTLIGANGDTIKLSGPYDRAPVAATAAGDGERGLVTSIRTLVASREAATSTLGVVRGASGAHPTVPWVIDTTRPGDVCLRSGDTPVLWRGGSAGESRLEISPPDRGWRAAATWPVGSAELAISRLPISEGSTYTLELDGSAVVVTFHIVPPSVTTDAMRAAWMAYRGCDAQAGLLANQVAPPAQQAAR
jgi:hypothetical protein